MRNYRNQDKMPRMCEDCTYRKDESFSCKAFPAGIPGDVLSGDFIHDRVHPDQPNRLIYEPERD